MKNNRFRRIREFGAAAYKYGLKRKGISSDVLEMDEKLVNDMGQILSNATDEEFRKLLLEKFK